MKIEQLTVNDHNMIELMRDESVYAIKERSYHNGEFNMEPIKECEIGDLLSGKVTLIRITK